MSKGIQQCTKKNLWKTVFKKLEGIPSNFLKAVFHRFCLVHSCTQMSLALKISKKSRKRHAKGSFLVMDSFTGISNEFCGIFRKNSPVKQL